MTTVEKLRRNGINVDLRELQRVAREYQISEISVFGSSIREDMSQDSDVDLLVRFDAEADVSLFDLMELEERFGEIFGRPVDIVEPESLTNSVRRRSILANTERLYAA
jgi:predicted nucleotidyltransferase